MHRPGEAFFDEENCWYQAVFNRIATQWSGLCYPESVFIKDETLREGEETPGVRLTIEDKLKVAEKLYEAGVREVEVGYAGSVSDHYHFTRELKRNGPSLKLSSHTRAYSEGENWKREIDRAIEAGVDVVNLVAKSSTSQLTATPWLKREQVPDRIFQTVSYAKGQGATVGIGLADPARTAVKYVVLGYQAATSAGADRLYVYDGPGCASPEAMAYLTTLVRAVSGGVPIAVHCHNDFGLAVANSLAAVRAGATMVDTVVNGLGDRAGNAAFEETVCALEVLYGINTSINLEMLCPLSDLVAELYGIVRSPTKPIVGENAYRHETDSHVANLIRGEWDSFEVIRAEALGRRRRLEFGPSTLQEGDGAIRAKIESLGLKYSRELETDVKRWLREQLANGVPFIPEEKLERQIRQISGGGIEK